MRILHISQRYWPPAFGGAELYVRTIAEWNVKQGHKVDVWTTDALDSDALWHPGKRTVEKKKGTINGVHIRRFRISPFIFKNFFWTKIVRYMLLHAPIWKWQCLGSIPFVPEMYNQLKRKDLPKYDIIHVCAMPYNSIIYIAMKLAKLQGAKLYITPFQHIGVSGKYLSEDKYYHSRSIPLFANADYIFVQTESEKNELTKYFKKYGKNTLPHLAVREGYREKMVNIKTTKETPSILRISSNIYFGIAKAISEIIIFFNKEKEGQKIDENKLVKVGLGVFPSEFAKGGGSAFRKKYGIEKNIPVVFYVGTKSYLKGIKGLVNAMELLWKNGVEAKLVIAGTNTVDSEELWKNSSEIIKRNTVMLDRISDEERYGLYETGDIFVSVSKSESFGITYLEAWLYKKPVIGCGDVDAVCEVIDEGVNGYLCKFDDVKIIAAKIEKLLKHPSLRRELGENGYSKVMKEYTWNKKFKILERYYK